MRWRTVVGLGLCALGLSACTKAAEPSSAFFCQGEGGPGRYIAFAAIRKIPDGDVEFAISGWEPNGHHFGLFGIAVRSKGAWVFKEWPGRQIEDEEYGIVDEEVDSMAGPSCKVTIQWDIPDRLMFSVDQHADCDEHAGASYGNKSTRFVPRDYMGPVRGELDGWPENFFNSPRCDEPRRSTSR